MSTKSKRAVLDQTTPYGVGVYEDAKSRLKYQTLMQDYEELQKDADVMRKKLEASKEKKLTLAAEVRFLRRRYKYLMKIKNANPPQEQTLAHAPNPVKRAKVVKEQPLIRKEASQYRYPLPPEPISRKKQVALPDYLPVIDQPRKKKSYTRKEVMGHGLSTYSHPVSDLNHKGVMLIRKEAVAPILDRNPKERMFIANNDATLRNSGPGFDLNLETIPSEKEAKIPTRAPIFDLNEISTGDEDFQGNVEANKFDESRKSLIRGINEDQQNDLKLSICRNSGESSSRAGKRKISWQDPVALRV